MLEALKQQVRRRPHLYGPLCAIKARRLERQYVARRELFAEICRHKGLVYSEEQIVDAVRARLHGRPVIAKKLGEVHTFFVGRREGWVRHNLYDELEPLGPCTTFDWADYGFDDTMSDWPRRRREMNELLRRAVRSACRRRPVDWVFIYADGRYILADTVRWIIEATGVPTVNMCLDDTQSFVCGRCGEQDAGQVDIAGAFDLSWTSNREACLWYLAVGARPLWLYPAANPRVYCPQAVERDLSVSFAGACYGSRSALVAHLRQFAIRVETHGPGWEGARPYLSGADLPKLFCRSRINLGMGEVLHSRQLTHVKCRDFEVPMTGGGVYLTSFNPELALSFHVGKEVVCYRTADEAVELARWLLAHPEEATGIAQAARRRALREHRWLDRFQRVCRVLGVLRTGASLPERPAGEEEVPAVANRCCVRVF